ncbi:MAG: GntR family transcriptional regulator [Lentisphaeria bacterium]|nr:GntR family transcriptional regulator [Lentisphaeria bacterium]
MPDEEIMIQGRKTKTTELAEKLKAELRTERLPKDSQVMSVRELAGHFGISTNTAARVLDLLVGQNFLSARLRRLVPPDAAFLRTRPQTGTDFLL